MTRRKAGSMARIVTGHMFHLPGQHCRAPAVMLPQMYPAVQSHSCTTRQDTVLFQFATSQGELRSGGNATTLAHGLALQISAQADHLDTNCNGPVVAAVRDAVVALAALEAHAGPQQRRPLLWCHLHAAQQLQSAQGCIWHTHISALVSALAITLKPPLDSGASYA